MSVNNITTNENVIQICLIYAYYISDNIMFFVLFSGYDGYSDYYEAIVECVRNKFTSVYT